MIIALKTTLFVANLLLMWILARSMKGYTDRNAKTGTKIILSVLGANTLALIGGIVL